MTNEELNRYYNKFNEEHRLKTRHGKVEFSVSMKYIHECLEILNNSNQKNVNLKILDLGAGTGAYSVPLCLEGFDVTSVELADRNIKILRDKHQKIKTWKADARNLSFLDDEVFDLTLIFGPLYHIHTDEEKLKVFSEAKRVTKKGGFILASYVMNDYSIITYGFKENHVLECLDCGSIDFDFHTKAKESDLYDYVRLEDINRLNKKSGLVRKKIIAADGAADYLRKELNAMDEKTFETFIQYQISIAEKPELLGASSHVVDILQK